jgi:hypothetical protein
MALICVCLIGYLRPEVLAAKSATSDAASGGSR